MAVIGFGDLKLTSLPALWDEDYLKKVEMAEGTNLQAMIAEAQIAMQLLSNEMLTMPHYSGLFSVQTEAELEYATGTANEWQEASEFTPPDPVLGATTGHMLPIKPYDVGLGWTYMYLRKARQATMQAHIQTVVHSGRNLWQKAALTRLFTATANTIGSTSSDLPFAEGGSADSTYVPVPSPEGNTFLYTHNHYLGSSTTGITASTLDQSAVEVAIYHLYEHGLRAPFELVGAEVDATEWANAENVTGWKPPLWQGVAYQQSAVERMQSGDIQNYVGGIETKYGMVNVWLSPRIPSDNFAVYKTFGAGAMQNPLRMRIDKTTGFGFRLIPGIYVNAPATLVVGWAEFGFGVGPNRCAAVLVDVGASTWAAPTIS